MAQLRFLSRRVLFGAFLVVLGGLIQSSGIAAVAGVRPNILLAILITLAFFFRQWASFVSFIAIAAIFSKENAGFSAPYLALTLIAGALFFLKERFPGTRFFNVAVGIATGTLLTYLAIDFTFLSNDPFTVFIEVIYNVLVGMLVYLFTEKTIGYETEFRASL